MVCFCFFKDKDQFGWQMSHFRWSHSQRQPFIRILSKVVSTQFHQWNCFIRHRVGVSSCICIVSHNCFQTMRPWTSEEHIVLKDKTLSVWVSGWWLNFLFISLVWGERVTLCQLHGYFVIILWLLYNNSNNKSFICWQLFGPNGFYYMFLQPL